MKPPVLSRLCHIEGCERPRTHREWCNMHWQRWYRHGDPLLVFTRKSMPPLERFRGTYVVTESGCWQWTGPQKGYGYGCFVVDGVNWRAHRWAYLTFVGPIAEGLELDHLCRNKLCVNPDHLEAVTRLENIRRRPTGNSKKTHCKNGHEFTPENTAIDMRDGRPKRRCRECNRIRSLANYRRDPETANRRIRESRLRRRAQGAA